MSRKWRKLGCLYCPGPEGRHPKLISHAANPLALHLVGDVFRIFYSGRDERNRSSVGAVDVDIVRRMVIRDHNRPFFEHGAEGSFFASGVSIGGCYEAKGKTYMLFMGWQTPPGGHWRGDIGRLLVGDDLELALDGRVILRPSDQADSISHSYPWVAASSTRGFTMWYGSTMTWDAGNGEMLHVIKSASSVDGEAWTRDGIAVPYEVGVAQAFSRPTVLQDDGKQFEMWFSVRGNAGSNYRIGYAKSPDGKVWELALEEAGIGVSPDGWDSDMIEYPFVFRHGGRNYMLYNGNGYGRTGFGLAVSDD
jgi:hypothetical protein